MPHMTRTHHAPKLLPLALAALLAAHLAAQQKVVVVQSALTQELQKLFPELPSGYIDLNGNGKVDQTSDLNELIPESRVRDGQLQAQEILDFIVANWRYIPLSKLQAVQKAMKTGSGAIGELIALDFSASMDEAIRAREAMGDQLYLTPSAYKDAMDRIGGIVSSMASAYKKEGQKSESDFVASRDALFAMVDKGYPLPEDLPAAERGVLATSMVSTILKEGTANPGRTRMAIKVIGRLKSTDSASYLLDLAAGSDFPVEAMKALGEIGYKPAIPVITKQLRGSSDPAVRKAALQATGAIGGAEGLDAILELVKPASRDTLPPDLLEAAASALSGLAQKGNADPKIQAALKDLSGSDKAPLRSIASTGLGSFTTPASAEALLAVLNGDKDSGVRKAAVISLGRQKNEGIMPAFMKTLRERDLDPSLKSVVLTAIGSSPGGAVAIGLVVEALADKDQGVKDAASATLIKLYPGNQALVTGSLSRSLLTSQDEGFLVQATGILATLADPTAVPSLLGLLQKPQSEVKRMATWALYRTAASNNPKVVDELQKLVTNENESLAVRTNAVRALGAIGFDSPQANVWQTMITTAQMRGEKYAMLRLFAVRTLGLLGAGKPQVTAALSRIATREADIELRKEAVSSLKSLSSSSPEAADALASSFAQADDPELKVRIIEALADMGSDKPASLAGELLASGMSLPLKRRVVFALSQDPGEESAAVILDAAKDEKLQDFAVAVLEGYPASMMSSFVGRRLRTETDKSLLSVLGALDSRFSQ